MMSAFKSEALLQVIRVLVAVVVLLSSPLSPLAQGNSSNTQKPASLQIVDAKGKFVAYPFNLDGPAVRPLADGTLVTVWFYFRGDAIYPSSGHTFFESADCSGTPLASAFGGLAPKTYALPSDSRLYLPTGSPVMREIRSHYFTHNETPQCETSSHGTWPTQQLTVAFDRAQFQPPFKMVRQ